MTPASSPDPLQQPCPHLATPAEQQRDPRYRACEASPGSPCRWARRYDGIPNPAFHSERLEWATEQPNPKLTLDPEALLEAVLQTGLV